MLNGANNSIRGVDQNEDASGMREGHSMQHYGGSLYDNLSFDALFGSHYDSDKDEDYSMKEDLIQNTKTYKDDQKQFNLNISKAEVAYLKSSLKYDSLLFGEDADSMNKRDYFAQQEIGRKLDKVISDSELENKNRKNKSAEKAHSALGKRTGTMSQTNNLPGKRRKIEQAEPEEGKEGE